MRQMSHRVCAQSHDRVRAPPPGKLYYDHIDTKILKSKEKELTRGSVMSPGAIGTRERMPAIEALRPLRVVSIVVLHNTMLQPQISVFLRLQYYTKLYTSYC